MRRHRKNKRARGESFGEQKLLRLQQEGVSAKERKQRAGIRQLIGKNRNVDQCNNRKLRK